MFCLYGYEDLRNELIIQHLCDNHENDFTHAAMATKCLRPVLVAMRSLADDLRRMNRPQLVAYKIHCSVARDQHNPENKIDS